MLVQHEAEASKNLESGNSNLGRHIFTFMVRRYCPKERHESSFPWKMDQPRHLPPDFCTLTREGAVVG